MLQISAEFLAMSGEAAVLIKNGKIIFANTSAYMLFGHDCVGHSVARLFGKELAEIQAPSFIGEFPIKGQRYIVRMSSNEGIRAFFFSPGAGQPALISDAFIFSLRNGLMSIGTNLSLLQSKEELPPDVKECLSQLNHERFNINRIISNISILKSALEKNYVFSPESLDLAEFFAGAVRSISMMLPTVDIRFTAPKSVPAYADPRLLDTMLMNLISNCLVHGKDCSRISIALSKNKDKVILSVDDNGCGIPASQLHSVFDRYCYSFSLDEMNRGAGLGLSVVRHIAGVHGGTLLLESRENQGTAVRVSLSIADNYPPKLKHPEPRYERTMDTLLTGLANCLPLEMFTEKYAD